jgi:hypothetical protein
MLDPTPDLPDDTLITRVQFPTRMLNALKIKRGTLALLDQQ